ncbi:MAG: hypothetical protein E3K36_07350 [Candidatus Brocadia sp.]|nr:hypothetical protein [Candidatus Brocadia sp.]
MKSKIFVCVFALCCISFTAFGQFFDYEAPLIRLKTGLPTVFAVEGVREISGGEEESVLNVSISVKKGRIESVSRDAGCWIVTVRTSSKEASTYLIKDSVFKIVGEESKKIIVNAIHWKDGN